MKTLPTLARQAVWFLAGILVGLSFGVITGGDRSAETAAEAPAPLLPVQAPGQVVLEREVEYSPEVDAWHRGVRSAIGNILTLSGPIGGVLGEFPVETLCEQIAVNTRILAEAELPPAEPLDSYFADWIAALEETRDACRNLEGSVPESTVAALVQRPAFEMDIFLRELDRRIDLTRGPDDPAPGQ